MQQGTAFNKAYGKEIFGIENTCYYIYPCEELAENDIFPYFVMDGGAFNLINDLFGQVTGKNILDKVMSDELFEVFRNGGEYNWEKSFAYTKGTDFIPKYEWQIWPQRLYMILPLAHAYLRTGDTKYTDKWLEIVKGWDKAHPYYEFDDTVNYLETDMVWRDMQVAWRTLSFLHSAFMLQEAPYSKEDWEYLYDFIYLHTKHLYLEAKDRLSKSAVQNHVLQIGTALILSSCMFPEFDISADALEVGKQIIKLNMKGIYSDGGSEEDSPSYGHFIARLYLEALLLLENNNKTPIEGLKNSVLAQYRWLYLNITPCGNAPRMSDSYSIDAKYDIEIVSRLINLDLPKEKGSVLFPENNYAIIRNGNYTVYADAVNIPKGWGHIHSGRPQILMFYKNRPIIVDTGICNYDRWEFYNYVRSVESHNVVFSTAIDENKMEQHTRITEFSDNSVSFASRVICGEYEYTWTRKITICEDDMIIEDIAESEKELPWRSRLLFARTDIHKESENIMKQLFDDRIMTVTSEQKYKTALAPVMNDENKIDYAIVMESTDFSYRYYNKITFNIERR